MKARTVARALRPGGRFAFSVEILGGVDYCLLSVEHFAYSRPYLHRIAAENGMHVLADRDMVFPRNSKRGGPGALVIWSRVP